MMKIGWIVRYLEVYVICENILDLRVTIFKFTHAQTTEPILVYASIWPKTAVVVQ